MSPTTTEHAREQAAAADRPAQERSIPEKKEQERKEPTFLFTEKQVAEKSEIARRMIETRARLNANVDKANNFLVKRFYNIDHNTYWKARCRRRRKN